MALTPPSFVRHRGITAALPRVNVDTDQIVPKQFLTGTGRTGFGAVAFHDWRFAPDGSPNPAFELNRPEAQGASILLAGANFGCGSSREHAVWALVEYGFRALLAESFADIFSSNACRNGLLPVRLPAPLMREVFERHAARAAIGLPYELVVDLEACRVSDDLGLEVAFEMDPYRRDMLLRGLDEIGRTLQEEEHIAAFERARQGR